MQDANHYHLGVTLLLIHQSISRGIQISRHFSRIFGQGGFPDDTSRQGFADYVRSLATVLRAHHLTEDELAFPRLRELLPGAPYDLLTDQHRLMESLLDEIGIRIGRAAGDAASGEPLAKLESALTKLEGIWKPHIEEEEAHFTPGKIDSLMQPDEQTAFVAQMAEFNQRHSAPDYLVVPFTLFNLALEDRNIMSQMMPPIVTQHLVPVAWKEKWRPMMPFLRA